MFVSAVEWSSYELMVTGLLPILPSFSHRPSWAISSSSASCFPRSGVEEMSKRLTAIVRWFFFTVSKKYWRLGYLPLCFYCKSLSSMNVKCAKRVVYSVSWVLGLLFVSLTMVWFIPCHGLRLHFWILLLHFLVIMAPLHLVELMRKIGLARNIQTIAPCSMVSREVFFNLFYKNLLH